MLTAPALKALLRREGLRLSKRLGQHHLIDPRVVERLIDACQLGREDTVVEIGAGLGALTEGLADRAGQVVAVEVDAGICRMLARRMQGNPRVRVVHQDVLGFPWEHVRDVVVVGALPYSITSPILVRLSEARRVIRHAWLILQREVADRLSARPRSKAYGRLSLLAQYCWDVSRIMPIGREAFFPAPAVSSMFLRLTPRPEPPVRVADEAFFFRVVKTAFAQRRKTLLNCLRADPPVGWPSARLPTALREVGLPASVRGEALSLDQFARLANYLLEEGSEGTRATV